MRFHLDLAPLKSFCNEFLISPVWFALSSISLSANRWTDRSTIVSIRMFLEAAISSEELHTLSQEAAHNISQLRCRDCHQAPLAGLTANKDIADLPQSVREGACPLTLIPDHPLLP